MEQEFQRWAVKRGVGPVHQLICAEDDLVDACREHNLKQSKVERRMEIFLKAGQPGPQDQPPR